QLCASAYAFARACRLLAPLLVVSKLLIAIAWLRAVAVGGEADPDDADDTGVAGELDCPVGPPPDLRLSATPPAAAAPTMTTASAITATVTQGRRRRPGGRPPGPDWYGPGP